MDEFLGQSLGYFFGKMTEKNFWTSYIMDPRRNFWRNIEWSPKEISGKMPGKPLAISCGVFIRGFHQRYFLEYLGISVGVLTKNSVLNFVNNSGRNPETQNSWRFFQETFSWEQSLPGFCIAGIPGFLVRFFPRIMSFWKTFFKRFAFWDFSKKFPNFFEYSSMNFLNYFSRCRVLSDIF